MSDIARRPSGTPTGGQFAGRQGGSPETALPAPGIERGAWVSSSRHGHRGRVTEVHDRCPESPLWVNGQVPPVTDDDRKGQWVSILCHGGGAVVVPIASVRVMPVDEQPAKLDNLWASERFGDD